MRGAQSLVIPLNHHFVIADLTSSASIYVLISIAFCFLPAFDFMRKTNIEFYYVPISFATIEATSTAASFGKYAVSLMPEITRVIS